MANFSKTGKPFWLEAVPNEGALDYFGFRFYRQPLRSLLVRGAAANNFSNSKTLIYYGAIAYAFRFENNIESDQDLNESQLSDWNDFYKIANYLYTVNYHAKYNEVPDSGFTGAVDENNLYFKPFYQRSSGSYDIKTAFPRIYPEQRRWGYLAQFWMPPLRYFRCVLEISECIIGEYAKESYGLLSQYSSWPKFIKILNSGVIERDDLDAIQGIIDCRVLNDSEKQLAQKIIFDTDKITEGENDNYKINFQLIKKLKDNGYDGFYPQIKEDYALLFSYVHLKNQQLGDNDFAWKILYSSLCFEIGITRLFTLLNNISVNGMLDPAVVKQTLKEKITHWKRKHSFGDRLDDVKKQWMEVYTSSIWVYKDLFQEMLDLDEIDHFIDGLLQGYLLSQVEFSEDILLSEPYQFLTDPYHYFAPQPYFENKKIRPDMDFGEFIEKLSFWIIDEQFDFSLDRMNIGQKAKFILTKSEFSQEYIFQVTAKRFEENRGIIDMIGSSIKMWESAGIY
jgi:hypothetical protein